MTKIILAAVAIFALASVQPVAAAHKGGHKGCVMAGGQATMVTEELAKFMADAALKNAIAAKGWRASGAVKMKCDTQAGLPHCVARRRACS